jgi:hypothetical protein
MITFDLLKFAVTYEAYIDWRKHTGFLDEEFDSSLIGKHWYLTIVQLLDEEDLVAFRLKFGV